jgi:hypothetical protein
MRHDISTESNEEILFFINLAIELVDESYVSIVKKNTSLLGWNLTLLKRLCDYLAITFNAPTHIENNSEVLYQLNNVNTQLNAMTQINNVQPNQ